MSAGFLLFGALCKRFNIVLHSLSGSTIPSRHKLPLAKSFTTNWLKEEQLSFTVSYLIKYCGLSLEQAKSASTRLHFETTEGPNSVLELLRGHGFSNTQISKIVRQRPLLLLRDAQKTLLPKVEFFRSVGASVGDVATIFSSNPTLLDRSVEKFLVPLYNFLKTALFLNEQVIKTLKRPQRFVIWDSFTNGAANLALLRSLGLSQSSITLLLTNLLAVAFQDTIRFSEAVQKVKAMGFEPWKSTFVVAIVPVSNMTKSKWDSKFEVYQRWGWSKEDTLSAFKKEPHCLLLSDAKIVKMMNFFVNKMGYSSQAIAQFPTVLLYSYEKRVVPRCSVFQVLLSKRLIKQDHSLATLMPLSEKYFVERYVTRYEENIPQLLDLYKGKLELQDLGIKSPL